MYNKVTKPNNSTTNNKRLSQLPKLPSLILPPQGNIPKVNLGNPTNNNMPPLLSEEDIEKIIRNLNLVSNSDINTESDSAESDRDIPEKMPDDHAVINQIKTIFEAGVPEKEQIFIQSQFNKFTFNPNWYDEYIEENIPENKRTSQNHEYPRIIELRDYLNKKNPNHPNPANIIDFFMWAKGKNSNKFIHEQIGIFQKLFTWISAKEDANKKQIYPNIIGKRPYLKNYDMNYIMDKLKQEWEIQHDAGVKEPKPALNHLVKFMQEQENKAALPIVDRIIKFIQEKKNKVALPITFGEFIQYLQEKFTKSQ